MLRDLSIFLLTTFIILIFLQIIIGIHFQYSEDHNFELIILNNIITTLISISFVYIAYIKIQDLIKQAEQNNNQNKLNYLLKIDERWSSKEIIIARKIIHKLYLDVKNQEKEKMITNDQIARKIGEKIIKLKNDTSSAKDFIYLLNFLDFFETIGYLHYKKSISIDDINELCGNSIRYFFIIFQEYIFYRKKEKDILFYDMFIQLYKDCCKTPSSDDIGMGNSETS